MTEENWRVIEKMLDKITNSCMGQNLYNALLEKLNGKTLAIEFVYENGSSFYFNGSTSKVKLDITRMESNYLFHEMWHAYQAYQETVDSYKNAELNIEIEAHFAQYLYLKNLPEYPGSRWHRTYIVDDRHWAIADLETYVSSKGELKSEITNEVFEVVLKDVISSFANTEGYKDCKFDYNREILSVFKNLDVLTKDC